MPGSAALPSRTVSIALGERSYDIVIGAGLLRDAAVWSGLPSAHTALIVSNPTVAPLYGAALQQALAPIMIERNQVRQQAQQEAQMTVEQMALDPKYPYFEEVRSDMADLIDLAAQKNIPLSLDKAYNLSVQMNPELSAQMDKEAGMQHASQQHLQAQRAKAAASSVTGAPAGGGSSAAVGDGSLRGTIEAAFSGQRI